MVFSSKSPSVSLGCGPVPAGEYQFLLQESGTQHAHQESSLTQAFERLPMSSIGSENLETSMMRR